MRKPLMAGNWKMNKLNSEIEGFCTDFIREAGPGAGADTMFAVPFVLLQKARQVFASQGIQVAAQNVHWETSGAFTGEISTAMLKELGVTATLIGHSERRQYFNETDATVARKTAACLKDGILPVICIGETLEERESGATHTVIKRQLAALFSVLSGAGEFLIAYEPVWAIGTGRSATSAQAQEVHKLIRDQLHENLGAGVAGKTRILYGGSANPANIDELLAQPDIDGGLVGGASLKPADFARMVISARKRSR